MSYPGANLLKGKGNKGKITREYLQPWDNSAKYTNEQQKCAIAW